MHYLHCDNRQNDTVDEITMNIQNNIFYVM